HPLLAYLRRGAAVGDDILAPGDFGGFAETHRDAMRLELVEGAADSRVRAAAGCRVGLAALGRDPQVVDRAFDSLQLGSPLHVLLRDLRGAQDRVMVT